MVPGFRINKCWERDEWLSGAGKMRSTERNFCRERGLGSPAEVTDQFVREQYVLFLRTIANIVDDQRHAIGADTVRYDAGVRQLVSDQRREYVAGPPVRRILTDR